MDIPIFSGSWGTVAGTTPFGYFDNDPNFIADAPKIGKFIVYRLGWPIVSLELQDINIYAAIEDSIMTYSSEVNKYNIKQNLLSLQGSSTSVNLTHKHITPNLGNIITISKEYGSEAGSGGNVEWKKGYITTQDGVQSYDLDTLWSDVYESGSKIEIKRVYHYKVPASAYFFNSTYNINREFGWDMYGNYQGQYLLSTVGDDALKMQQIEFNQTIRQSAYSFYIKDNRLEIFPKPTDEIKIWFEYIVETDRSNMLKYYPDAETFTSGSSDQNTMVSDISNAPYDTMPYSDINAPGKSWIREYSLACTKEFLGIVRSKYASVPVPDNEVTLDGDTLRNEAATEKQALLDQLRELLDASSRRMLMEAKQQEAEYLRDILAGVPSWIFIG